MVNEALNHSVGRNCNKYVVTLSMQLDGLKLLEQHKALLAQQEA